ncbi:MAG: class I SAM-dependent methyltransferase [Bacteroidales bacterium]|nr:class I SAM-dependent methyltransferase [Bacteroidales bacterium]
MENASAIDAYGKGLLAYHNGRKNARFKVESNIAATEFWPVSEFFHDWADMSLIERKAIEACRGRVLDVGAGSGSHVLQLQNRGLEAHAIDISAGAVEVMQKRGVKCVEQIDFFALENRQYDTLLMLMNGAGIAGTIDKLPAFFDRAKRLLTPGGQLILDSSDIMYLFEDEDGSVMVDLNGAYYGELEYTMSYGREKGEPFEWLFIDFDTLQAAASECGMKCEKLYEDDHYQYLARITN